MQVVVLCPDALRAELLLSAPPSFEPEWVTDAAAFSRYPDADLLVDLSPDRDEARLSVLQALDKPVLLHSLTNRHNALSPLFVRINAWPGFLRGGLVEGTAPEGRAKEAAEAFFSELGKEVVWLPDEPGYITARVVSMIINEAYFALEEGISTREEMDTAMKLGTAYPYGPFEWAGMIGPRRVAELLQELRLEEERYAPAPGLLREAGLS